MSEILDNQGVATEMLNNIAADLGIPEFNGFGENKFGVEALNKITGDLTGKGILNINNKCALNYTDGILTIDTGVIVFDDGAKLRITEMKTFEIPSSESIIYVYAVNDTIKNKIELQILEEELTTGDFLLLCQIENGILHDKRKISTSKTASLSPYIEIINPAEKVVLNESILIGSEWVDFGEIELSNPCAKNIISMPCNGVDGGYNPVSISLYDSSTGLRTYAAIDKDGKGYIQENITYDYSSILVKSDYQFELGIKARIEGVKIIFSGYYSYMENKRTPKNALYELSNYKIIVF